MKHTLLSLCISIATILPNVLNAQAFSDAVDYHNFIANEQNIITAQHINYISYSVHSDDYNETEKRRLAVINQLEKSIDKIGKISAYDGEDKLKAVSIEVLEQYLGVFKVELNEANVLKQDSKSSYEAMEQYFKAQDKAEEKLDKASKKFDKAQAEFAKKHELKFESDDESSSDIFSRISKVNNYTRELFLIYFKVSKANAIFYDALNERKGGAMEKTRRDLLTQASQGLALLRGKGAFMGDSRLLESTKKLITYYRNVAGKEYAELTRIVKNQDKLTQDDVNNYNKIIESMPKKEQTLINDYSQNRQQLLRKHIPNTMKKPKNLKRT